MFVAHQRSVGMDIGKGFIMETFTSDGKGLSHHMQCVNSLSRRKTLMAICYIISILLLSHENKSKFPLTVPRHRPRLDLKKLAPTAVLVL